MAVVHVCKQIRRTVSRVSVQMGFVPTEKTQRTSFFSSLTLRLNTFGKKRMVNFEFPPWKQEVEEVLNLEF